MQSIVVKDKSDDLKSRRGRKRPRLSNRGFKSKKAGVFRPSPSEPGGERAEPTSVGEPDRHRDRAGIGRKAPAF